MIVPAAHQGRIPLPPRPPALDQPVKPRLHELPIGGTEVKVVSNQAEGDDDREQGAVEVVVHRGGRVLLEPAERVAFRPAPEIADHRAPRRGIVEGERRRRARHHGPGEGLPGLLAVVDVAGDAVRGPPLVRHAAQSPKLAVRERRQLGTARGVPEQDLPRPGDPVAFQIERRGGGERRGDADPDQRRERTTQAPPNACHGDAIPTCQSAILSLRS